MYFYYTQSIPYSTLEDKPVIFTCDLIKGKLDFIDIGIPKGVNRLAKLKIFYNEYQIIPFNRNAWFSGNDITLRIPLDIDIKHLPAILKVSCINLDDTYDHELAICPSISTEAKLSIEQYMNLVTQYTDNEGNT
jgi:hypothetical protein